MYWNPALSKLQEVLADLYPEPDDRKRILANAGIDLIRVEIQGKPINSWGGIIEEALKQEKLEDIINEAEKEYPPKKNLLNARKCWREYKRGSVIPGYVDDIVVSYISENNTPYFNDEGSSKETIEALMEDTNNKFHRVEGRDPSWSIHSEFDSTTLNAIQKSAVVVVIWSKNYQQRLQNSSDEKEDAQKLQKSLASANKIFFLEMDEIQSSFRASNIILYKLWQKRHDKREYFNQVRDISEDITNAIFDLKKAADLQAKMSTHGYGNGKPIFINHAPIDKLLSEELVQRLRDEFKMQGHITFPLASKEFSENKRWFESRILRCDGLFVLYGKVSSAWVGDQLDHICRLLPQREQPPEACALYYGPPDGKEPLPSDSPKIISVDCQKCPGQDKKCGDNNITCAKELLEFVNLLI